MHRSTLRASEVEALTFIYAPAAPRPWAPPVGSGAVGMAVSWVLIAALTWIKFAACAVPESYGL